MLFVTEAERSTQLQREHANAVVLGIGSRKTQRWPSMVVSFTHNQTERLDVDAVRPATS
jgi:hypothetical protein